MPLLEGKRGWYWPLLLVALLLLPVAANGYLMLRATNDPSHVIEKDYYKKAVAWDQHQAQESRNAALGWHVHLTPGVPGQDGRTPFVATLRDRSGQPVAGAHVDVAALRIARSGQVLEAKAAEDGQANYAFSLPVSGAGLHEFHMTAQRGPDVFTTTLRQDLALAPKAQP